MSEDGTNKQASALGYADEERADMIIGAARILRKDVTTRSGSDSLSRLLLVFDKASRFDETMRALVEGDAAHAEIVRGLRAELRAECEKSHGVERGLRKERDKYKALVDECTEALRAAKAEQDEAAAAMDATNALLAEGIDALAQAGERLAEEQTKCSERIAELAKAHNEVVLSYERELRELRKA